MYFDWLTPTFRGHQDNDNVLSYLFVPGPSVVPRDGYRSLSPISVLWISRKKKLYQSKFLTTHQFLMLFYLKFFDTIFVPGFGLSLITFKSCQLSCKVLRLQIGLYYNKLQCRLTVTRNTFQVHGPSTSSRLHTWTVSKRNNRTELPFPPSSLKYLTHHYAEDTSTKTLVRTELLGSIQDVKICHRCFLKETEEKF